jgi:hypothetical protein
MFETRGTLEFDADEPMPGRTPPIPDELVAFIRANHRGLSRITVKLYVSRRRYAQINGIRVGAAFDQTPEEEPETICRAIMAICAEYHETVDKQVKFLIQAHVYKKATGDAIRKGCHIELGREDDMGGDYSESIEDPERLDTVLLDHIRRCHGEILKQAEVISEVGKEAIKNAGEVFRAKEEAIQARAAVSQTLADDQLVRQATKARDKRMDDMVALLKDAVTMGVQQYASSKGQAAAQAAQAKSTPSLLSAAKNEPLKAPTMPIPTPNLSAVPDLPQTIPARMEAIWSSLDDDRRQRIELLLTKPQLKHVQSVRTASSSEEARPYLDKFVTALMRKPAVLMQLRDILTPAESQELFSMYSGA